MALELRNDNTVWLDNRICLGDFVQMEDGYYEFFPTPTDRGGFVYIYVYEFIVSCWHKLNDAWHESLLNDPVLNSPGIE